MINRLAQLCQGGGIEFAGVDVLRLRGPVVYMVSRGEQVMYVGMSRRGLVRPFQGTHRSLSKMNEDDRLQVWPMVSVEAAQELEGLLIGALRPAWNQRRIDFGIAERLGVSRSTVRRWRANQRNQGVSI